jgi:hypothetical protein
MSLPIKPFSFKEVVDALAHTNVGKTPGYDLISGKMLKELPKEGITLLTILYNSILRLSYYPLLWKFAQIIMIPKLGKHVDDVTSYRPINLLPFPSKVYEKLLLKRLRSDVDLSAVLPDYQFSFRVGHSTIHQTQRVVHDIAKGLEGHNCVRRSSSTSDRHSIKCGILACYINSRPHSLVRITCSWGHIFTHATSKSSTTVHTPPVMRCCLVFHREVS